MAELISCPFCGAGESRIDHQNMWTGMRNQLVCVHIRHWCEKPSRSHLCITANTEEEAVAEWNKRAAAPPPAGAQQAVADVFATTMRSIFGNEFPKHPNSTGEYPGWEEYWTIFQAGAALAAPAPAQGEVSAEDQWIEQTRHLNCPVCNGSGHVEDVLPQGDAAQRALLELLLLKDMKDKWEAEELSGFAYKSTDNHRLHNEQRANYLRRKPLAWEAARKALAAPAAAQGAVAMYQVKLLRGGGWTDTTKEIYEGFESWNRRVLHLAATPAPEAAPSAKEGEATYRLDILERLLVKALPEDAPGQPSVAIALHDLRSALKGLTPAGGDR